ncbi:MAG: alpha/beta hydrolase [Bryobacterales bacterium]|nr:alpha/beta hydrolase [Bryobacterales bacterium]
MGGLLLIALLASAGLVYQAAASARDLRRHRAPGQMVDVGGHRLHLHCIGEGAPVVVLESGLGEDSTIWALVQPEVAKFSKVCAYDRAGYAWSDPGPLPRTSARVASELHALLRAAAIPGPYVLVGHSLGGFHVRVWAHQYAEEVAGVVLVSPSHEDLPAKTPEAAKARDRRLEWWASVLLRFGVPRLFPGLFGAKDYMNELRTKLPPKVAPAAGSLLFQTKHVSAYFGELDGVDETYEQVRAASDLGDVPLTVVTERSDRRRLLNPDEQAFERAWDKLMDRSAKLSKRGKRVIAEHSGHLIQLDRPDVVVTAIRDVFNHIRLSGSSLR